MKARAIPMIVPLIVCGGSGTRLWPASRASRPKQFLRLFDGLSTFRLTLARVADPALFARPVVVTSHAHRFLVADELDAAGIAADVLLEPEPRESGPAILAGALHASARDGDEALALSLAADHLIRDVAGFEHAVRRAIEIARSGRIVTFGITPDHPATGYGYIEPGEPLGPDGAAVRRFVEKPDEATARAYVERGFLWNSGNFLFPASRLLADYTAFEPETVAAVHDAVDGATTDLGFRLLDPAAFARAEKRSVDRAVMEKSAHVAVVPAGFDWSDVGSWSVVHALTPKDRDGNAASGSAYFVGAKGNLATTEGPAVAIVGLDDLAVIATADAVLVGRRGDEVGLRALVQHLQDAAPALTVEHEEAFRPWGRLRTLDRGERHQVRRIVVKPGKRLSLQMHRLRAEHWIVTRGTATVTVGDEVRLVAENESVFIPAGAVHRLENAGSEDLEIIEVQSGASFGEDDVTRFEDVPGADLA